MRARFIPAALVAALLLSACGTMENRNAALTQPPPEPAAPFLAGELVRSPKLDRSASLTRIAFGSCLNQSRSFAIGEALITAKPQLMLMIGDNVYGDTSTASLDELIGSYAALNARPDWQRVRRAMPMLATWDDHDYGFNDAGADFPYKRASQKLFAQFWDLPLDHPAWTREGIYDSLIVGPEGQRVQIILLDTRSFRSPLKDTDERDVPGKQRYMPDPDPAKTMLGDAQWAWLEEELRKPAELRLLVSSIQVIAEGHGWERWGNLPHEQKRLYDLIARTGAKGVVFLSGDRHQGALYKETKGVPYPLYEITSSSLNMSFARTSKPDLTSASRISDMVAEVNFGLIDIDWATGEATLSLRGEKGEAVATQAVPFGAR